VVSGCHHVHLVSTVRVCVCVCVCIELCVYSVL